MKTKTIIIDDIQFHIEKLKTMLSDHKEIDIVSTATTKAQAISSIKAHCPDLVIINLQHGNNDSFEILNACASFYKYVIFISDTDASAIECLKYNALSFIQKPLKKEIVSIAIDSALLYQQDRSLKNELENSIFRIVNLNSDKIYLLDNFLYRAIDVNSIIYIKSNTSYSTVYTIDRNIKMSRNLSYMHKLLANYPEFIRVHKSFVVNKNHIVIVKRGMESTITLTNGHMIPASIMEKGNLFKILGIKD